MSLRVAAIIPAYQAAPSVGTVVRGALLEVAEVLVVDDGSTDATADLARAAGARVISTEPRGKGQALRRAVAEVDADIVVFLDADVSNVGLHFVTRLVEPLLADAATVLVKAAYDRSADGDAGGGRVTELLARPLLRRLFPELAFLRQPLAGEVAVRRQAVAGLALEPGYGIEIGMLIDIARRYGAGAIVEADLGERIHRNRPLVELSGEADEVLAAALSRAGL